MLMDEIGAGGFREAQVAAGSKIVTDQRIETEAAQNEAIRVTCSGVLSGRSGCRRWRLA
jgi:hypothetical protein